MYKEMIKNRENALDAMSFDTKTVIATMNRISVEATADLYNRLDNDHQKLYVFAEVADLMATAVCIASNILICFFTDTVTASKFKTALVAGAHASIGIAEPDEETIEGQAIEPYLVELCATTFAKSMCILEKKHD